MVDFRIPEPCTERWEEMEARPAGRLCRKCDHEVIDISRLTRKDASRRVKSQGRSYVCVRLEVDAEGEALFRKEPRKNLALAAGFALASAMAGCESSAVQTEETAIEADADPMLPLPDGAPPAFSVPQGITREVIVPQGEESEPTREQIALTERKHRPSIRHMVMGRMPIHSY